MLLTLFIIPTDNELLNPTDPHGDAMCDGVAGPKEFYMAKPAQKHQIKVLFPPGEHDRIRLAAALRRVAMSEFCRGAAVAEAARATKGMALPQADRTKNRDAR